MKRINIEESPIQRLKRTVPKEIWEKFKGVDFPMEVAKGVEDGWRAFKASTQTLADSFPTITPKHLRPRAIHKAVQYLHKRKH